MLNVFNPSVKLSLYMEQRVVAPGDNIRGFLKVEVTKEIEITSITAHLVGMEKTMIRSDKSTHTSTFKFYSQYITLFGQSRASGSSGKVYLSPGAYTYDFDVALPLNIPPSAKLEESSDESAKVAYTVEGRAVIPWWVDTTTTETFEVLCAAPVLQFTQALSEALPLGRFECGEYHCGCNSSLTSRSDLCYCFRKPHNLVLATVDVYPSLLLVGTAPSYECPVPLPDVRDPVIALAPNTNTLTVRLSLENQLSETIHRVEVELFQKVTWSAGFSNTRSRTVALGRTCYDASTNHSVSPIKAGDCITFDATVPVTISPIPSMKTKYIESTTLLIVRFPEYNVPDVRVGGRILVANTVSALTDTPWLPGTFTDEQKPPEIVM